MRGSRWILLRWSRPENSARVLAHKLHESAYAFGVGADIAHAHAREGADIEPAAGSPGADANHDVILEAEPERGAGRLDAALLGNSGDDLPAQFFCRGQRAFEGLLRGAG